MLKQWSISLALILTLGSFHTYAAQLGSDLNVELMAIDGNELKKKDFDSERNIELPAGTHQVVYRYVESLRDGSQNALFTSSPYISTIEFAADDKMSVVGPKFANYNRAKGYFFKGPDWKVRSANGTETSMAFDKLTGTGFMPFADIEKVVNSYNKEQNNQFAVSTEQEVLADVENGKLISTVQYLYENASAEERQALKEWMLKQK
jgi:uncharacterized protein